LAGKAEPRLTAGSVLKGVIGVGVLRQSRSRCPEAEAIGVAVPYRD
jgi:hypothetical protein